MIKTYAATYVSLQENLTNSEKISIIKWIKEAETDEIKNLLVTGQSDEFHTESVELFDNSLFSILEVNWAIGQGGVGEAMKGLFSPEGNLFTGVVDVNKMNQIIDQIASNAEKAGMGAGLAAGGKIGLAFGLGAGIAASAIAALVIVIANRAYKRFLSKAARACNKLKGDQKTNCMIRFKQEAIRKKISDLQNGIDSKMRKLKAQLGAL